MSTMDLRTILETRIREAEADIEKLRAALGAIDDPEAAPAARAKRPRSRAAARPQPKVVPLGKLLQVVTEQPGITTTALAHQTGGAQSAVLTLLKEQEGSQVRREGERRATRWFAITDEDRVAARAQEIAAQQRAANGGSARPKRRPKATNAAPAAKASRSSTNGKGSIAKRRAKTAAA